MTSFPYRDRYQALYRALEQLHETATRDDLSQADLADLERQFKAVTDDAQQIMQLDMSQLDAAIAPKLRSYLTEINKQLRLLGTDIVFLKTARQSQTAQQRQARVSDRIQTLMRYCNTSLELGKAD